jgi:Na+/melibiose symporter-like transporter
MLLAAMLGGIAPTLYAKDFGLSLASVAAITLAVRLADALGDALVGYWNDRRTSAGGSPRPLVASGAIGLVISAAMLSSPPEHAVTAWFACWLFLAYVSWSLFEIPHNAWGADLAPGYAARARLFGARATAAYGGVLLLYLIPLLPFQASSAITPSTMRDASLAAAVIFMCSVPFLLRLPATARQTALVGSAVPAKQLAASVAANRPLRTFLLAYLLAGLSFGMYGGLLFLYVDSYLGLAEHTAIVFAISTLASIAMSPVWAWAAARFGKHPVWSFAMIVLALLLTASGFLEPGAWAMPLLVATSVALFGTAAVLMVTAPAVLADLVDYGRWKFDRDPGGTYFAAFSLTTKAGAALGAGLGLAIAAAFGFSPADEAPGTAAIFGLKLGFAWAPALCAAASLPLILASSIEPRRVAVLQRRVARRAQRRARMQT